MNPQFAIFDTVTGRIAQIFDGPERRAIIQMEDGQSLSNPLSRVTQGDVDYINPDTKEPNQRPVTPCTVNLTTIPADGETPLKLSQMRDNTLIEIDGPDYGSMTCSGSDTIIFVTAGNYTITASAPFPCVSKTIKIVAT